MITVEVHKGPGPWNKIHQSPSKLAKKMILSTINHLNISVEDGIIISVSMVNDKMIRAINKEHRGKDKATNVLSFPYFDIKPSIEPIILDISMGYLGEIIFSANCILRESEEMRINPSDHMAHLAVHGTLHILGYDHEHCQKAAEIMEKIEIAILAEHGISNPYA